MTQDPPTTSGRLARPLAFALGAVLAAASAYVLPAADAVLPGGAIVWQLLALGVAAASACWAYRAVGSPAAVSVPMRLWVRLAAAAALLLVLLWIGGVGILWLIWPR